MVPYHMYHSNGVRQVRHRHTQKHLSLHIQQALVDPMLSLAGDWAELWGVHPPCGGKVNDDDDEDSDSESGRASSCASPEPRSPPHSPLTIRAKEHRDGPLPEIPSLPLSPRSVVPEEPSSSSSFLGSSWMCVYDLDSLCLSDAACSADLFPSAWGEEISAGTSEAVPYMVDLFNPEPVAPSVKESHRVIPSQESTMVHEPRSLPPQHRKRRNPKTPKPQNPFEFGFR